MPLAFFVSIKNIVSGPSNPRATGNQNVTGGDPIQRLYAFHLDLIFLTQVHGNQGKRRTSRDQSIGQASGKAPLVSYKYY